MHPDKINNILALSPEDRYDYLIAKAAEWEELWLIKDGDSYATMGESETQPLIPVWPEEAFARLFVVDEWSSYTVEPMEINDFLEWLDTIFAKGYGVAGFPIPGKPGVVVTASDLKNHILYELSQYE